jgi:four helix bundle protein
VNDKYINFLCKSKFFAARSWESKIWTLEVWSLFISIQNVIAMKFKFEKLIIWQKAMDLRKDIYKMSPSFPKEETYNLSSQIRRAFDSIALNISEGSIGQSNPEFERFMEYSIRSLTEVVTCLHKANRRNYITSKEFDFFYTASFNLRSMMIGFRKKSE